MTPSVYQYAEAICSPAARMRTLGALRAVRDSDGLPALRLTGRMAEFEIEWQGARWLLCCPCARWRAREAHLLCRTLRTLPSPHLSEYTLLEEEILIGERRYDAILHRLPEGEPLEQVLARGADRPALASLLRSLAQAAQALAPLPFTHRNLTPSKIVVRPDGSLCLTRYHYAVPRAGNEDCAAWAAIAASLAVRLFAPDPLPEGVLEGCCDAAALARDIEALLARLPKGLLPPAREALAELPSPLTVDFSRHRSVGLMSEGLVCVEDEAGFGYVDCFDRTVIAPRFRRAEPFREGRAEVECESGAGLIDKQGRMVLEACHQALHWDDYHGVTVACRQGRWGLFDREGKALTGYVYDWAGECSEGLVVVRRGGKLGYVDCSGREVIPLSYDDAYSFRDGRALVRLHGRSLSIPRPER